MAGVPFVFGNATTSIPLTNLDANFNTGLTIGNTTVGLGNIVTTLGNVTLTNANFGGVANAVIYTNSGGNITSNASVFSVNSATNVVSIGSIGLAANANGATGKLILRKPDEATGNPAVTRMLDFAPYYPGYDEAIVKASILSGVDTGTQNGVLGFMTALGGTLTEAMRIDSSGNLLVGTTSSSLGTGQSAYILAISASGPNSVYGTNATGNKTFASFNNPNGQVGYILTNGTSTTYATSSDYRLKENIAPMIGALDVVQSLKPVTYNWKADGSAGQGFIAHELQAVVPDCVSGEKDAVDADGNPEYQGIDTSFLVATLTAAIQELKSIVDTQATQISALQAKVGV